MSAPMDQKEYLKKYLAGNDADKKRKKKKRDRKPPTSDKGVRIMDDSLDLKNVPFGYTEVDDGPTVAEITYEDEKMKHMEEFTENKKWKKIQDPNGKGNDDTDWLQFGSQSPPRKMRHDSGSPPRKLRHDSGSPPRKMRHDSESPPRKMRHDSISPSRDIRPSSGSPPRRARHDSGSPARKMRHNSGSPSRRMRHDSGSRARNITDSISPPRKARHDSGSPPRRDSSKTQITKPHEHYIDGKDRKSDSSQERSKLSKSSRQQNSNSSASPSLMRHDLDKSPPRKKEENQSQKRKQDSKTSDTKNPSQNRKDSSPLGRRRNDSDMDDVDASPPRKNKPNLDHSPPRRKRHGSDTSPPRRKRLASDTSPPRKKTNDWDASPPRRKRLGSDSSPVRNKGRDADISPPRRPQNAQKEQRPERKMTTKEYLIARKHGKLKKDTPEELARKQRESVLQREAEEKNQQWKHGVKQVQDYKQKLADDAHEMGKAFSRTADDVDMNKQLKVVTRREDPMLEYMMKKDTGETTGTNQAVKPIFKGPFPPNRLNIRPGYRWDGVDRSSGFEKRWFEHQNNKRAIEEDAYKWSVADM